MAKLATVGGITGIGFLALGLGLPKVIESFSPTLSYGLAAFGGVLVVAAFVWFLLNKGIDGRSDTALTTHGAQSANYGHVQGDVINHYGLPPEKTPKPYRGWDDRSLDGLERGLSGGGGAKRRGYARLEAMRRCPETRIADALRHLSAMGFSKEDARLTLQQAFRDGRIEVWGRPEVIPAHLQAPMSAQETWERVEPMYWKEFKLTEGAFASNEDQPQTHAQSHVRKRLLRRYWSLRVSGEQMREEWPNRQWPDEPHGDDGTNWKTV